MLRHDWNALRSGDHVLVHHTVKDADRLIAGVVTSVAPTGGSNDVEVRLNVGGRSELVRPQRLHVHHDPIESDGSCWRCSAPRPVPTTSKRRGG
jgi:hypothetical protein